MWRLDFNILGGSCCCLFVLVSLLLCLIGFVCLLCGLCQVYRAIHRLDGHEVAVKATDMRECYFQSNHHDSGSVEGGMTHSAEKILKEAHMMRLLQHPKIIKMEDVFSVGTTLFMVMEMVHGTFVTRSFFLFLMRWHFKNCLGGDLFERVVAKKRYDEDQVCHINHTHTHS